MKKLVIYNQDHNGNVAGDVFEVLESSTNYKHPLLKSGITELIDLPKAIDLKYLQVTLVDGAYTASEDVARKATDDAAQAADVIESNKTQAFADLKAAMNAELYTLMYSVAGTSDFNSAMMYESTWKKMVATPSNYSSLGVTARFDRGAGITIGDTLDTDTKVTNYAQACLDAADAAELTRMQRIEQYKVDVAALAATYA